MPQQLLNRYFLSDSKPFRPSGTSFLDLPVKVRRRVYVLAGLVRFCPIDLNLEGADRQNYINEVRSRQRSHVSYDDMFPNRCYYYSKRFGIYDERYNCICPPLPYHLLYVSRTISAEVSSILYSENSFQISRSNRRGLKPLRNLNPKALASLRSITIRLRSNSCIIGHNCRTPPRDCGCHPLCNTQNLHDKPLSHSARQDRAILEEWSSLIDKISVHVRPSFLRMSVVCDVKNDQTALLFLEPFFRVPRLRDCAIRLGQKPNLALQYRAERTTRQAMGLSFDTTKPLFQRHLPGEVLTHILGYTDLIAPFDLEWRPDKGLAPFDCCKKCTDTLEVCCCSFYHAAFSSTCTCWRLPISIFLVCHKVRGLATHIFYTRNRFIILPRSGKNCGFSQRTPAQGGLSLFLASLPLYAWKDLRYVQWTLPPIYPDYMLPGEEGTLDWSETIGLLSDNADLSKLSLTINMSLQRQDPEFHEPWHLQPRTTPPGCYETAMMATYQRILKPMVRLQGLRNLFVHLSRQAVAWELKDLNERRLENLVMGKGYDSASRGKFREPILWNDGYSDEGPVFRPDGYQIWPPDWSYSSDEEPYYSYY